MVRRRVNFSSRDPLLTDARVTTRTSSIEALDLFRVEPQRNELVITDMTMPQMTGDRLPQKLMGIRPDLPAILCKGFSQTMTEEKAAGLRIKAFLIKPLVMKDLARTLKDALDGK